MRDGNFKRLIPVAVAAWLIAGAGGAEAAIDVAALRPALNAACAEPYDDPQRFRAAIADARIIQHDVDRFRGQPGRAKTVLLLNGGSRLDISVLYPGGKLRRITAEMNAGRPQLSVTLDNTCRITEAREIEYDGAGRARAILIYKDDLTTVNDQVPLNPAVPDAADPGGISVGLIDSGVNYLIDPFKSRLARDAKGKLIGRDFWDGDDRPFDADLGRSPFFPLHHGSAVMSVLIGEAPSARVVPVRYPRPDMSKMADVVDWLAGQGVRVVNLAMGSNSRDEWQAFDAAARKHPRILFIISAGNDGRDIDRDPVYPAALRLSNAIVVTSSMPDGRLAPGSNWGGESVDIMTPGERIEVIDHRGVPGRASGSSFAVPRISALAARALAANPDWHGPELRDFILKRARQLPGPRQTRYGWIPDPLDGP